MQPIFRRTIENRGWENMQTVGRRKPFWVGNNPLGKSEKRKQQNQNEGAKSYAHTLVPSVQLVQMSISDRDLMMDFRNDW